MSKLLFLVTQPSRWPASPSAPAGAWKDASGAALAPAGAWQEASGAAPAGAKAEEPVIAMRRLYSDQSCTLKVWPDTFRAIRKIALSPDT